MEESELEEGEACFYKDDHDNIDTDIDFSHIDKRIRRVLGPFQKDFEGGVSAENLGAMFGGYGSFLPTNERSPCNWSRPKTPQKNQSTFRSPSNLQTEGASHSQILKGSSNEPPSVKHGTVSISARPSHNKSVPSGDVSAKMTSCLLSTQVADKCSLKDGTSNRSENPSDQKTMKIRIKISDNTAQMNAINSNQMNSIYYSGLGLEGSPSSSSGNSSEESGGIAPVSREIGDESPTKILEVMTSFPLPEDVLISPLNESLLHLTREEKLFKASKIDHFPVVVQQDSMLADESVSLQGSGKLKKEKKTKLAGKSKRHVLKNGKATYLENGMIAPKKMTSGKETPLGEEFLPNGLKTPLSNSVTATDAGEILKVIGQDVFREANKDEVKGRLLSSGLLKEESLDSLSHQGYEKNKRQNFRSSLVEKDGAQRVTNFCKDDDSKLNKFKGYKISTTSKAYSDASKLKENLELQRQSVDEKSIYPEQVGTDVPHKKGKQYFEGKRMSMGMLGNGKPATVSTKESLNVEMGAVREKRKSASLGVAPSSSKMQKLNSHGDKVRDTNIDLLSGKDLEQKDNRFNQRERPSGEDASLGNVEVGHTNFLDEPREALSGKKNDTRLISAVTDVPVECPPVNANGLNTLTAPGSVDLVQDTWAFCDRCKTWRLLPHGTTDKDLPKKWFCKFQNWLPAGMNKCSISEKETTKMLYALNQMPVPESYTNGNATRVTSVNFQHLDHNFQTYSSDALPNRGKKKLGLKETSNPGSSSSTIPILKPSKNHLNNNEFVRSRSSNDMNPPSDLNLTKKFSSQHTSEVSEKDIFMLKKTRLNGGAAKEIRKESKRKGEQCAGGTSKRPNVEGMYNVAKHHNSDDNVGKEGFAKSTKTMGNEMKRADNLQVSLRNLEDQSRISSDGLSLGPRRSNKKDSSANKRKLKDWQENQDSSTNKRKLKDWQENQIHLETVENCVYDVKVHKEESSERGFKREMKFRVSKTNGKESTTDNGKKIALDGVNLLKRDLAPGQVSTAATSSSSKISGSHKSRGHVEEAKASPVESVSSSPLRTYLDKPTSIEKDVFRKSDPLDCVLPSFNNSKRFPSRDAGESNHFGTSREEKIYFDDCPESYKMSVVDHRNGDAEHSSEVGKRHLLKGKFDVVEQDEDAFHLHKSCKASPLQSNNKERIFTSDSDRTKVADLGTEHSKKIQNHVSKVDSNHHVSGPDNAGDVRHGFDKKCSIKSVDGEEKNKAARTDFTSQGPSDHGREAQGKRKENDGSDMKSGARYSINGKGSPQLNMAQDSEGCFITIVSKSLKSKLPSHSQSEGKKETPSLASQPVPKSERAAMHALPVDTSVNNGVPNISKHSRIAGNKNRVTSSSSHLSPDLQGAKEVNASSPRRNSSDATATSILKEAKELKDYADRLKSSGFAFESNEAYFQAALKFLHGAGLLETCSSDGGKHGEMSQLQVYSNAAKLCELCARDYESCQEMAATALAYKCMEVAYMKVVFCKNSYMNRDRHELQATLNMVVPQGESPLYSASDVENFNTMERAKGASHAARSHVITARLLEFTEDVNLAMDASKKSQAAFIAANAILEAAQHTDCIAHLKRAIDFSFHDVDELIHLVRLAMKATSRTGFGGARD